MATTAENIKALVESATENRNQAAGHVAALEAENAKGYAVASLADSLLALVLIQNARLKVAKSPAIDRLIDMLEDIAERVFTPPAPIGTIVETFAPVDELIQAVREGLGELEVAAVEGNPRAKRIAEAYKACMRPIPLGQITVEEPPVAAGPSA